MKQRWIFMSLIGVQVLFSSPDHDIPIPEIYQQRRAQLLADLGDGAVAVFYSGDVKMRIADVPYRFRVDNNFYYLTGCTYPSSLLLLVPGGTSIDNRSTTEILFLRSRSGQWYGNRDDSDGGLSFPGLNTVLPYERFSAILSDLLNEAKTLYVSEWPTPGFIYDVLSGKKYFLENEGKKTLKKNFPKVQIKSVTGHLQNMRHIKSPPELALMQRAIDITCDAFAEAARSAEPGMYEYELQAVIEYVFTRHGAEAVAFPCIIGSGPNSLILHYDENRRQMQDGDVVVMDIGAEYHGYCADLTRTIPVNGRFSPAQKQLYEIVLKANQAVIDAVKPGITIAELNTIAQNVVAEGLMGLGIITEAQQVRRFLPHGVSHPLGLQAHDVGAGKPLAPGVVVTVEPGIYIPAGSDGVDPRYDDIGIRIEDDVLVTETGCKVMTEKAPKTIIELERLMKKKGIGNQTLDFLR